MRKSIAVPVLCLAMCILRCIGVTAAEVPRSVVPEWFFEVKIGIPLSNFVALRPHAAQRGIFFNKPPPPVDLSVPDQILEEQLVFEVKEEHFEVVSYHIRGGKLRGMIFLLKANAEHVKPQRASFLQQCLRHWGDRYEKRVVALKDGRIEYLTPMLAWSQAGEQARVFCSPELKYVTESDMWLGVVVVEEGFEGLFANTIPERKVDEQTKAELFHSIGLKD